MLVRIIEPNTIIPFKESISNVLIQKYFLILPPHLNILEYIVFYI